MQLCPQLYFLQRNAAVVRISDLTSTGTQQPQDIALLVADTHDRRENVSTYNPLL
ncbi:hypothetical protein [Izhakiella capsodis]|uniref:hypothetical protein n=1 Tax=Izhakiella capsodis TaxID=1367852 RepID=UPI0015A6791D|nr:hypothetical protein [Izhakiella capsodis]